MERVCKNCGSVVYAGKRYCSNCGAKWIENRITLRNVAHDFTDMYIGLDTKFVRTFVDLFKRPEAVIDGFIKGRRMGYVDAIRYLFISLFLTGVFIFVIKQMNLELYDVKDLRSTYENLGFSEKAINDQVRIMEGYAKFSEKYMSFIILLSIPIYALLGKLTFWGKRYYNYTEHIVVQLYAYSHVTISLMPINLLVIFLLPDFHFTWSSAPILFMITYNAFVFKRLFKLDLGGIILKTFMFFVWIIVVFSVLTVIGGIGVFVYLSFTK